MLSGIFILIRFLISIIKGKYSTFKDNKASSYIYSEPRQQLHIVPLEFFPLMSSYLIFHSLLPALIAGIVPGVKHLTETFCCSLNGYEKWQIVTAGAALSKINQECAKNSDSFCRIPEWNRHCLDWRKRQLINCSQIKTLGKMRSTEVCSWSQQVCHRVLFHLLLQEKSLKERTFKG